MSSTASQWQVASQEVLAQIDVEGFYKEHGLRLSRGASPNHTGWLNCHAIDREDKNASAGINVGTGSARGRYKDFGGDGKTLSLWDFAAKLAPGYGPTWQDARRKFAEQVGIQLPTAREELPSDKLEFFSASHGMLDGYARAKPPIKFEAIVKCGGMGARWPRKLPAGMQQALIAFPAFGAGLLDLDPTGYGCVADTGGKIRKFKGKGNEPDLLKTMTLGTPGLMNVHALKHLAEARVVWVVEGITDMLAVQSVIPEHLDREHVVLTTGACSYRPRSEWAQHFAGKILLICMDADKPGQTAAKVWAAAVVAVAAETKLVQLPYEITENHGKDLRDFLSEATPGCEYQDMIDLADRMAALSILSTHLSESENAAIPVERNSEANDDDSSSRVRIDASIKDLTVITPQAWSALGQANNPPTLFRYGGVPSRIERSDHGELIIRVLDEKRVRYQLARAADFIHRKLVRGEWVEQSIAPTKDVVEDILATPDQPLPVLRRIVEAPVFAEDGTLQITPGFHERSQTYYDPAPGFSIPEVPEHPTGQDIESARTLLCEELLGEFPFVDNAELAHAVALLLLPFSRDLIDGPTPLHLIEKPTPGTGATLLADMLSIPSAGRPIAAMTEGRDDEEWRKRITAKLMTGSQFLLIDNVRRCLDSAALASAITAIAWEDRILGGSTIARLPVRCAWVATGNNPAVSLEMARRTVRIRLDARKDRPWLRDGFRHADLRGWAHENRGLLVWAALTLIRAWLDAGRPPGKQKLGMFEQWSTTMGGIMSIAGLPDFLGNLTDFYDESDTEGSAWREFLAAWWHRYQTQAVKGSDLFRFAADTCLSLGEGLEHSQRVVLGKMLAERRDRIFELEIDGAPCRVQIQRGKQIKNSYQWYLKLCEG